MNAAVGDPVVVVGQERRFLRRRQVGEAEVGRHVGVMACEIWRVLADIGHQLAQALLLQLPAFGVGKAPALGHEAFGLSKFYGFHCLYGL